ncbi:MAG: hypothetical protein ABII12_01910 [Planctomycetota bacterium]
MTGEQTTTSPSFGATRRPVAFIVALAAALGGSFALVRPFVRAAPTWQWAVSSQRDLDGAAVNADLLTVDAQGVLLAPQGDRAISLISAPLSLPADASRLFVVRVARPELLDGGPEATTVNLLWQTEPRPEFHFETKTAAVGRKIGDVVFSLPCPPSEIHRLGVQFPDVQDPVRIEFVSLLDLPPSKRFTLAWQQAGEHERYANHSINYIRGPSILGHGFNYFLIAAVAAACGWYCLTRLVRRRRVSRVAVVGIVLAAWFVADVQATANLWRQTRDEVRELGGKSRPEQMAAISGPEIAWAYEQMLQQTLPGSTYVVISDDPFTAAHRLDYLLAPQRTRRDSGFSAKRPDYVVVIHATDAAYDSGKRSFWWRDVEHGGMERVIGPVVLIAAYAPDVLLLEFSRSESP